MKKTNIVLITLLLVVVGISLYYYHQKNSQPLTGLDPSLVRKGDPFESESLSNSEESGTFDNSVNKYVEYSKETFESSATSKRVMFFYASWCPTCIPADADFKFNLSLLPEDVTVIRVNYNDPDTDQEEKDLAEKYGITYQHTFVQIDEQGNEVTKWNGGKTEDLLKNIK